MPLRKALLEAPLSSGLNQKSDHRSLAIDGAEIMQNCVRTKNGAIRKRLGCQQLINTLLKSVVPAGNSFTITETQAVRGLNYGSSPLLFDGYIFSQYSDADNTWALIDAAPEAVALDHIPIQSPILGALSDVAFGSGYYVCVTASVVGVAAATSTITATIVDATSGAVIQPPVTLDTYPGGPSASVSIPTVIICGTIAVVAWLRVGGATPGIYVSKIDLTDIAGGWFFPLQLITDNIGTTYDITAVTGDTTTFYVAYPMAGGNSNTKSVLVTVNSFVVVRAYTSVGVVGTIQSISTIATSNDWCWVAYVAFNPAAGGTFTPQAWAFIDGLVTQIASITIQAASPSGATTPPPFAQLGIARVSSTDAVVFWTLVDITAQSLVGVSAVYSTYGRQVTSNTGGVTVGVARRTPGVGLYSRPLTMTTPNGVRCYAMVSVNSPLQGTQALVCFDWFGQTGVFGSGGAANTPARLVTTVSPRLAKILQSSSLVFGGPQRTVHLVATSATTMATLTYSNVSKSRAAAFIQPFDLKSQLLYFGGVMPGSNMLGISAGAPMVFDGQLPVEMGFLYYPEITNVTLAAGTLTGTFSYIVTYEWPDTAGNIHRSATSPPISVTLSSQNATLTIPTLGVTWRQRPCPTVVPILRSVFPNAAQGVTICVYRTASLGTIYTQIQRIDNDTSVSSVTFTNSNTLGNGDGSLLYTTGGVADNYCPPSARSCVIHKNRWFLAGADDPTVIWPSKALTIGEAPGFNELFNINATGAVTAMASLDEKLIVFVRRGTGQYGIEYVIGEGPFDTGAGNDWTNPPQPVPSAVGAIDQRSVAVFELGCVFMSPVGAPNGGGGIFLLSRDLQVHYISGPVEDIIATNPICTGVAVHPNAGRIYFEMTPTDNIISSTLGVRLVYDYIQMCWSSDTHFSYIGSLDVAAARATWVAGGKGTNAALQSVNMPLIHWVDYSGAVYRESSGVPTTNAYADVSVAGSPRWVTASFSSAWFKPSLSGFARFWRVQLQSDVFDSAQLSLSFQFDYAPSSVYTETVTFTDGQIAGFNRAPQCDVEHLVGNQKAKAIQVTLVDVAPIGGYTTGQGFQWASISIEVGIDDGGRYQNLPARQRS